MASQVSADSTPEEMDAALEEALTHVRRQRVWQPVRIVLDANILMRANPSVPPQDLTRDPRLTVVSELHTLVLSAPSLIPSFSA